MPLTCPRGTVPVAHVAHPRGTLVLAEVEGILVMFDRRRKRYEERTGH